MDFIPGARGPDRRRARRPRLRLRGRLGPLPRRRRRRRRRLRRLAARRRSRPGLAALLRDARRGRPQRASSTSSPTPTWSRSGATRRPRPTRDPRFYYEPAVEAIAETGVAVEVSTAGLRKPVGELYPARRVRRDVRRRRRGVRALLRRPRARGRRPRIRSRGGVDATAGASRRSASSTAASAGWSRWDDAPGRDRLRQPPLRRRAAGWCSAGSRSTTSAASRATPTPTSLTHAIIDALLGAAGLGDLGDPLPARARSSWRDADSIDLLRTVVGMLAGPVVNVDATVICEAPRLGPHRAEMERNLGEALGAPVSVKATTNEGMGFDRPRRGHRLHRGGAASTVRAATRFPPDGRSNPLSLARKVKLGSLGAAARRPVQPEDADARRA